MSDSAGSSSSVRRSWQDWLVVSLLMASYGVTGGFAYTIGLLQACWVRDLSLSNTRASFVSSAAFAMQSLPAPLLSLLVHKLSFKPHVLYAITAPLIAGGLYLNSVASDFTALMVANAGLLAAGQLLIDVTTMTAIYHYFVDDHIYLFSSIVSSGLGVGMIAISALFVALEGNIGWHNICLIETAVVVVVLADVVILCPPVARCIGIVNKRTRVRNLRSRMRSKDSPPHEGSPILYPDVVDDDSDDEKILSRNLTITQTAELPSKDLLTGLFGNLRFWFLLLSWALSSPVYNTIMYHQPTRLMSVGFSLSDGAYSIAINGLVQVFIRAGAGVLANSGIVSAVRMSELAKLALGVSTIASTLLPSLSFQLVYMLAVGVCGGFINTTDFMLIKDCVRHGRELGITVLFLTDGLLTLLLVTLVGYVYQEQHTYDHVFVLMGVTALLGLLSVLVCDLLRSREDSRRVTARHSYIVVIE